MLSFTHPVNDEQDPVQHALSQTIRALQTINLSPTDAAPRLAHLRDLLECLPMATQEFELLQQRSRNVSRYLASGEFGAAKWELKLLTKSLEHWLAAQRNDLVSNRPRKLIRPKS